MLQTIPGLTPEWVSAIATVVGSAAVIVTLPSILRQVTEARRAASAGVVADFYTRVMATATDRRTVTENEELIRAATSLEATMAIASNHPDLHAAIMRAANTYQYLGLLITARLLDKKTERIVLHEARAAFERFDGIARPYITYESLSRGQANLYKGHVDTVRDAIGRLPRPVVRRARSKGWWPTMLVRCRPNDR
jgi:hypothetical protein